LDGVPYLHALADLSMESWEAPYPLCKEDIPINTELVKRAEFLASKAAK
jgi:hypothetical protein